MDLILRDQLYPPLSNLDKVKLARSLTIHSEVDSRLVPFLLDVINTTINADEFFITLDSVVHLMMHGTCALRFF